MKSADGDSSARADTMGQMIWAREIKIYCWKWMMMMLYGSQIYEKMTIYDKIGYHARSWVHK